MSLKINIVEKHGSKSYSDLKPGDVFNYGCNNMGAVGLKTESGHVLIQSAYGELSDNRHITGIGNIPVRLLGKLIGVEVEKCGS